MKPELHLEYYAPITRAESVGLHLLRQSFIEMITANKQPELLGCEVGVYEGINANYMLTFEPRLKLVLVDAWDNLVTYTGGPVQGEGFMKMIKDIAEHNLSYFPGRTNFTYKDSLDAVKDIPDETFDYVYIDGDHTTEAVRKDMEAWWPKVKKGGVFGGHDVTMPEVNTAFEEFVKIHNIDKYGKDVNLAGRSDWWFFK